MRKSKKNSKETKNNFDVISGNINEKEMLKSLDDNSILELVNSYLPDDQKISSENGSKLVSEAKNLLPKVRKIKKFSEKLVLAEGFLVLSKKDLVVSKCCYNKEDYTNSMYHLQQCTEKIVKAYGLALGILNKEGLWDIKHQTPKAFIKMINEGKIKLYLNSLKVLYSTLNTDTTMLQEVLDTKKDELALLSYKKIKLYLDLGKKIDKALMNLKLDSILQNSLPNLFKSLNKESTISFSLSKFSSCFVKMYLIACITYPHESYTRYPDGAIKPKQYTKDMGVVKAAPKIFEELEEPINLLENFIKLKHENK